MTAIIDFDRADPLMDWIALSDALADGHRLPEAEIEDVFLYQGDRTLLNRSAWIEGLGIAVKCATIFPQNKAVEKPVIGGAVNLFSDDDGALEAVIDFTLVTKWKTAADSLLAARRLARPDSKRILIIGAGSVARSMYHAYSAVFPEAEFSVWNRTASAAEQLADNLPRARTTDDLTNAVSAADIISCATMSTDPVLKGEWLRPGQHVDLIGAFRPDMREADNQVLKRGRLFVDSRKTTLDHIGELKIPLSEGTIHARDVVADYSELKKFKRINDDEITVFKNGGGAHLDLMTCRYISEVCGI